MIKFLLIDDDLDDREFFCEVAESLEEKIICNTEVNGRKALEKLYSKSLESPDVIFLDVNMPVMNGWDFLRLLRSDPAYAEIPVIMYSTSAQHEELEKAKELNATSFLKKPTEFSVLKSSLKHVITCLKEDSFQIDHPGSPLLHLVST